jgi:cytoskeletal protein RodZ
MKKWIVAAAAIVVGGIGTTIWQVRQKGQELEVAKESAAPAPTNGTASQSPANRPPQAPLPPEPVVPPAPDADPGELDPPRKLPVMFAQAPADPSAPSKPGPPATAKRVLRREGTKLFDMAGTIGRQGAQFVFTPDDGSGPLTLLENLLLQRVDYLQEGQAPDAAPTRWKVSGTVTEYRGTNFLLLQRVVVDKP